MLKGSRLALLSGLILVVAATVTLGTPPDEATQALWNSFRFDEDGFVVDLDAIKRALDDGANPNYIEPLGRKMSVLFHAAYYCVNDASKYPETSRLLFETLRLLFDRGAHLQDVDGEILFFPVVGGHTDVVRLLLDHGASPTFWPPDIGTPLTPIEIATEEGYQDIVDLLIERGAKPLSTEQAVQLRFIKVAAWGEIDELESLLSQGARINGKNKAGETALISAIDSFGGEYGGYLRVLYLLDKGADLNLKGRGHLGETTTALHGLVWISSIFEENRSYRWTNTEQLLRLFIRRDAFVSGIDENEKTPLHIAAAMNGVETARILLQSGSKVMPRDKSNKTPLDYAESAEMIRLLKEFGAKEQ
jgi:ankyrin repeat protein